MDGACAYSAAPLPQSANPIPAVKIKENKDFDEWRCICHLRFSAYMDAGDGNPVNI
jgi:hypothetical protein